ncbi:hypothetical protein UAW_01530 [Enterococcus haemoperoxidus ATCC BAA-382]|uniref:Mga helix-turn-helix domain-containing protein n=1 Tax=Enterococcus haemoperoxidus ATCC BAA-382 TaxID=1158608 RepID=R2TDR9_9ENTE|nr:helix-turn-helix domain-containing protein [Enterococcus haemoperoxidus]EOH98349.1 hypothetical protein UAW_01530 [Enterococcus haemoperoxidus ATCC BAA-382]EOT59862.1 hypothetical protein I583_02497 [Enterococcus haemoperoxidus ATCC BAA-382]OJG56044.1 hypothetical protein RV06_GL000160 [Enterococcus haemoperoxidus]
MLMTQLIKKNEQIKLDLFTRIVNSPMIESETLQAQLSLSKNRLYHFVLQLDKDLAIYQIPITIQYKENKYIAEKSEGSHHSSLLIYELIQHYLNASAMFQLTYLFLHEDQTPITDIAQKLLFSQSHTYYVIRQVNPFLKQFNLKLMVANKTVVLNGRASDIFIFRFLVFSFLFFYRSPYPTIETERQKSVANDKTLPYAKQMTYSELHSLNSFFYVLEHTPTDLNRLSVEIQASSVFPLTTILEVKENELDHAYLLFFLRIFIPRLCTFEEMIRLGEHLETMVDFDLAMLAKQMLDAVFDTFTLESLPRLYKNYYASLYILTLHLSYIEFFGHDLKNIFYSQALTTKSIQTHAALYEQMVNFYDQFQPEVSWSKKEESKQVLIDTLYLIVLGEHQQKVMIYIDFGGNIVAELALKRKLIKILNPDTFIFTTDDTIADVIIANYVAPIERSDTAFLLVENFNEAGTWKAIYTQLLQLVKE